MPYCPYCGAQDYGTPFCVSCQRPILRDGSTPVGEPVPPPAAQVQAQTRLAGLWRRFFALFADYLIVGIIADIAQMAFRWGGGQPAADLNLDVSIALSGLLGLLYFTLLIGEGGQTIGKMLFDVRVVRADGQAVSYGRALFRALGYYLSTVPILLGFAWALWDRRRQAWHDKIADTIVVRV